MSIGRTSILLIAACQASAAGAADNPLLAEWTTPFSAPPFDRIQDEHFLPAYHAAVEAQRRRVKAIASSPEAPSFANTIEALEEARAPLDRIDAVFSNLNGADTNDRRQAIAREAAPLVAALADDVRLDEALFRRVSALRAAPGALGPEQARLLELTFQELVRGGARLGAEQKRRLRAINQELSVLEPTFGDNVLEETNAYRMVLERREQLAGLPEGVVAAAAEAAREAGLAGKWLFTLQAPSLWPFLTHADDRELRRQILAAYVERGGRDNGHDNRPLLVRIASLRAERARLLGYRSHADYVLEERMLKTPDQVRRLLDQVWAPARAMARREAEALQAAIAAGGGRFRLEAHDWRYYADKVKRSRYELDEAALRPYFPLDRVREGAFQVAARLYGLSFSERKDLPTYHPEVRSFEVKDADGAHLGLFYVDYHPRPGKRAGAWSSRYRTQHVQAGRDVRPIVVNVCNFSRPAGGAPALLSVEEVETLFHEFGHALHSLLGRVRYRRLATVPRDFVELPSQIMENWALEPEVVQGYARHWQTGEPIPPAMVTRLKQARRFNQGFTTVEYVAAAQLDMDWHTLASADGLDATAFESRCLERLGLPGEIVVRYRSPYFTHVFNGGYSAGYYSYLWSEVLDADAFEAFKERGLFDAATARAFRSLLERGNSEDAMELYRRFRGREPSIAPLLARRGLDS